ncbi:hypothetical protein [Gordonia sihwensis]|uniref:hypothetical protein n=1 Tax=Gordonia sihwensis TaxID=173559 RepID=UPI002417B3C1|nr:hypothetical protein [Gordonia sihwensis]WFN91464.1 hypothetical protein P5P27_11795 [Gordonia sihwensis]WFN91522.1 hypothetical protein P5P27_12085 [Gordonia sihwensis]
MAKTAAHRKQIADLIASLGAKITFHESDPGTTGAGLIATTPASGTTTWAAATDNGTESQVQGSAVPLLVPAGKTVSHYGIWNGSTFLRGEQLDSSIIVNGTGPVSVDVTPKFTFD